MKHFVKFLLVLTLVAGCEGAAEISPDYGEAYFPVEKGLYHIYSVHEVRYTASAAPEISDYQLMTEVVDSFPSAENTHTFVVQRSRKFADDGPWEPLDTWSLRKEGNRMVVSEGNTAYVKLQLPVHAGTRWNGNIYNSLGEDVYEYVAVAAPLESNGLAFENTLTVQQELNEDRIVFYDSRKEVYALGAGLVYKEVIQLNYCTEDHCLGQEKIDHGTELKLEITEYGKH